MNEEKVVLSNDQINAILNAAYALINRLGTWFHLPQSDADNAVLQTLTQVQPELQRLFVACPNLTDRQHTAAEIGELVAAATVLIEKLARTYPRVEFIPEVIRAEARQLFIALHAAGLIDVSTPAPRPPPSARDQDLGT